MDHAYLDFGPGAYRRCVVHFPLPFSRASLKIKPELNQALQEKLQSLPYSIANQRSLFVRFRHVDSVQFFGAGRVEQAHVSAQTKA
jgi:hypothetical protein